MATRKIRIRVHQVPRYHAAEFPKRYSHLSTENHLKRVCLPKPNFTLEDSLPPLGRGLACPSRESTETFELPKLDGSVLSDTTPGVSPDDGDLLAGVPTLGVGRQEE
ncbi:hypothetical protein FALBO_200 [Fusarium albosuccineum]|uniref:Uncharacterized protein n=1 Tax=Fusarium albosuccineum TaxID=1237068 RepID=A0A8H4PIG4_9HYPO|nr:hypothetical protein FALBO_200 [Fusarium albosuccineum]